MATAARRTKTAARKPVAKKAAPAPRTATKRQGATTPKTRTKATPAPVKSEKDVTEYATKAPTDYHKAFAKWIVTEVGFDPEGAKSKRSAFLMGVSIATAARPAFQSSEFLEEWREETGQAKRGPKRKDAAEEVDSNRRRKATREVTSDADFEDDENDDDDDLVDDEDEDFDEDESEEDEDDNDDFDSDDEDEDEDDEDEDEDFEEDEDDEEEPPPPSARKARTPKAAPSSRARKGVPARSGSTGGRKAAPAKASTRTKAKPADDDDDFLF